MADDPGMWLEYPIRELTVNTVLSHQARIRGDKVYVRTTEGISLTFRDVYKATNRIANWLMSKGIGHGSHVAVFMDNEVECLLSHIALTRLGAVSVPINSNASGGMLAYYLNFSDALAVISTPEFASRVFDIENELEKVRTVIVVGERPLPGTARLASIAFSESDTAVDADIPDLAKFSDLAFILFTSGTTGPSKGVIFPQARAFI